MEIMEITKLIAQLDDGRTVEVLPTALYAQLRGIKAESLKNARIKGRGKQHKYLKLGKDYYYITNA